MKTSSKVITISVVIAALVAVWYFFIRQKPVLKEVELPAPPAPGGMGLDPNLKPSVSSMPAGNVTASQPLRGALVPMSQADINNLKESSPAAWNAWNKYGANGWIIPKEYPNINWTGTATKTSSNWATVLKQGLQEAISLGDKEREERAREALRIELYALARYGTSTKNV